jgi:hypothetical protein
LFVCWCRAPSLTIGRVCCLQLLLAIASAVILESKSHGTHDRVLVSQIRDSINLEARPPYLHPPGTWYPSYNPRHWVLFRRLLQLFEHASTPGSHWLQLEVKVILRLTDSQSVSQSVLVSSPTWGSWPYIYYCLTVMVFLLWGVLSDERTGFLRLKHLGRDRVENVSLHYCCGLSLPWKHPCSWSCYLSMAVT